MFSAWFANFMVFSVIFYIFCKPAECNCSSKTVNDDKEDPYHYWDDVNLW